MSEKHTPGWRIQLVRNCVDEYDCYLAPLGIFIPEDLPEKYVNLLVAAPKLMDALQDLLFQVEAFCAQHGEADFETARALAAISSARATGEPK